MSKTKTKPKSKGKSVPRAPNMAKLHKDSTSALVNMSKADVQLRRAKAKLKLDAIAPGLYERYYVPMMDQLDNAKTSQVMCYWTIGNLLTQAFKEVGRIKGDSTVKEFAEGMDLRPEECRKLMAFVKMFGHDEALSMSKDGIHWTYIRQLISVHDPAQREGLLAQVADRTITNWRGMQREVIKLNGGKRSQGGRRRFVVGQPIRGVATLALMATTFLDANIEFDHTCDFDEILTGEDERQLRFALEKADELDYAVDGLIEQLTVKKKKVSAFINRLHKKFEGDPTPPPPAEEKAKPETAKKVVHRR